MAKNLKLNIKNAQLAEALKLGKIKKPDSAKAKKAPAKKEEPSLQETPPIIKEEVAAAPIAPKPEEKKEVAPPPAPAMEEPPAAVEKTKSPEPISPPSEERVPPRAPAPGQRPPYQSSGQSRYPEQRPTGPSSYSRPPQSSHYQQRPPYNSARPPGQYAPRPPGQYAPRPPGQYAPRPPGQYNQRPPGQYAPRPPGGAPYQGGPGGFRPRPPYPPRPGYGGGRPPAVPNIPPKDLNAPGKRSPKAEPSSDKAKEFKEFRDFKSPKKAGAPERTFDSRDRQGLRGDLEDQSWRKRRPSQKQRFEFTEEIIRPKSLNVRLPITVKDLASEMKLKSSQLISKLFMKGVVLTLNDFLDDETTVQLLGHDFDCEIKIDTKEEDRIRITDKTIKQEVQETPPASLLLRPPVAAFMGHVDHGKTSLIDAIRASDIASGEAGAITQHIGAFKCRTAVGEITILDTPGHEAFSAMRARGADVTDIVVLVVAGDEGIRTQTIEAIEQAKAAHCPVIVAINKADKPNFNPDNVYRQLSEHNLLPESWGGTTITVNCSALTKVGIKELLEMLALQAEVLELRANPNTRARGSVIESQMHKGMGCVATLLVQNGTLRLGDAIVFAQHFARVKTMQDEHGNELSEAGPSTPLKITGISGLPEAGSEFIVVASEKEAKELAEKRSEGKRHSLLQLKRVGLESLKESPKKVLNLILRADVQGSVEALKTSLQKIATSKVEINFIAQGVGEISESDINLASAAKATIIGFHTKVESHAESLIKELKVTVRLHDIIYHAVDDVRAIMLTLLDKIAQETNTGAAEVKAIFKASHLGTIAGCQVTEGTIARSNLVRVLRGNDTVWKGQISSLKRVKEDVREVSKGQECGILLNGFNDAKVGDILQAYEITYLQQEL